MNSSGSIAVTATAVAVRISIWTSPRNSPSLPAISHFRDRLGVIGFCGAPYTLASYMIEGGSSKNYIHTKQMMYRDTLSWRVLLDKLVKVLVEYCRLQVQAGADVIQIFDSWVGSLGLSD